MTPRPVLFHSSPPAELAPFVSAFVHRRESVDGGVVRIFPELRAAIQIQAADPYWVRARNANARWMKTPRLAMWGPRFDWAYGYARRDIDAYGIALTPNGMRTLLPVPTSAAIGEILDLAATEGKFAAAIDPSPDEPFEAWAQRIVPALRARFSHAREVRSFNDAVSILATKDGGAVAEAAKAANLSERQFRRAFEEQFGVSPKRYQRALRIDRMIRRLHPRPWERDAHGEEPIAFADQPHAIREFREMTGMTPKEYAAAKSGGDRTLRSIPVSGVAPPNDDGDAARY